MGKNKIPSVDHPGAGVEVRLSSGEKIEPIEQPKVANGQIHRVNYEEVSYRSREVTVKNLTQIQRDNLKRLVRELEDKEATLLNGSVVTDKSKAVRYLLENAYGESDE
jgi:hypothetical protein